MHIFFFFPIYSSSATAKHYDIFYAENPKVNISLMNHKISRFKALIKSRASCRRFGIVIYWESRAVGMFIGESSLFHS